MRYGQKWAIEHVWYPAAERVWGNAERLYAEQLQQSQWLEPDKLRQQGQERLHRLLNLCRPIVACPICFWAGRWKSSISACSRR